MNKKITTSSTDMCIDCMNDLAKLAETRAVSRKELKGWDPIAVMNTVNLLTGALEGLGPAVDTIEDAFELLESGELPRLSEEHNKKVKELLQHASLEW